MSNQVYSNGQNNGTPYTPMNLSNVMTLLIPRLYNAQLYPFTTGAALIWDFCNDVIGVTVGTRTSFPSQIYATLPDYTIYADASELPWSNAGIKIKIHKSGIYSIEAEVCWQPPSSAGAFYGVGVGVLDASNNLLPVQALNSKDIEALVTGPGGYPNFNQTVNLVNKFAAGQTIAIVALLSATSVQAEQFPGYQRNKLTFTKLYDF